MSYLELWKSEILKREPLAKVEDSYRLIHKNASPLRADKLGPVISGLWYSEDEPTQSDIQDFAILSGEHPWFLRHMINRGKDPLKKSIRKSANCPDSWVAKENAVSYLMRLDEGTSPGLFLDQRERRRWVLNQKKTKTLNLFCYTGGFSICAALAGSHTTSVDVSAKYIDWSKENFKLNEINSDLHEFWSADASSYLTGAIKRKREFDLIICDPPSFARNKSGVFSIEKDHEVLLIQCGQLLSKGGHLIFSTNYEGWSQKKFRQLMTTLCQKLNLKINDFPKGALDFEEDEPILKTALISR